MHLNRRTLAMAAALSILTLGSSLSATLTLKDLEGAWLADGTDVIFSSSSGKTTLRQPVNEFVAGFIISRDSLRSPLASCRIQKVIPIENGARLMMTCTNSMSTGQVVTTLRLGRAGMLERIGDGDTAIAYYNRCRLK